MFLNPNLQHFSFDETVDGVAKKSIKGGACGDSISSRIWKYEPISTMKFWQQEISLDNIMRIACTPPNDAVLQGLSWSFFQWFHFNWNFVRRVHVEALVNAIGDVVMKNFSSFFVYLHILRVDICHKSESFVSEISSGLWNHFNFRIRKVFRQAFINYFCNARLLKRILRWRCSKEILKF